MAKNAMKGLMAMILQPLQLTDSIRGVIFSKDKELHIVEYCMIAGYIMLIEFGSLFPF